MIQEYERGIRKNNTAIRTEQKIQPAKTLKKAKTDIIPSFAKDKRPPIKYSDPDEGEEIYDDNED
jgi:hypothetical protein